MFLSEVPAWRGVAWRGVAWCGVVWCGVVWCGVVWCGVASMVQEHLRCTASVWRQRADRTKKRLGVAGIAEERAKRAEVDA